MDATYPEDTNEGFCWDGACFGWFGSSGYCQNKKSLGESCINAGGNYDNNYCVTNLCSSSSGVCEQRTSGCSSFVKCVSGFFDAIAEGLASFTSGNGGSESWSNANCDDPDSGCSGDLVIYPKSGFYLYFPSGTSSDELSLEGSMSVDWSKGINADMDLKDFDMEIYIQDFTFTLNADIGIDVTAEEELYYYNYDGDSDADTDTNLEWEIERDMLLSDGLSLCEYPDSSTICDPYIIYRKSLKLGKATVEVEVGIQMIAKFKASVKATSEINQRFSVNKEIVIPKLGAHLSTGGIDMLGLDDFSDSNFDVTDISITTGANSDIESSFELKIGPQVYVSINGIEVYGAVDLSFLTKSSFQTGDDGSCISGASGLGMAMNIHFGSPPFSIGDGANAICQLAIGDARADGAGSSDITEDEYGTHCQILYMDVDDEEFGVCDAVGDFVDDLMSGLAGKTLQTKAIKLCAELFQIEAEFPAYVNGGVCNSQEDLDMNLECDSIEWFTFEDAAIQSTINYMVLAFVTIFIHLCL